MPSRDKCLPRAEHNKAWHKANPLYRKSIEDNGLIAQIGGSYQCHYEEDNMGKAVFFSLDEHGLFDSTYDDDVWEISIPLDLVMYEDPSMKLPMAYTNACIDSKYLTLIHKGTGEKC
jgi:hypothetical protein